MNGYRKILVAVDLSDDATRVLDKAFTLATQSDGEIQLVHVMEPIMAGYAVDVISIDVQSLQAEAEKYARNALAAIGVKFGIPAQRLHNVLGQPAREIRELAKKLDADLVVVGGHGKHGFELLLGSTSSGVTHGVSCDLLIVRLPDQIDSRKV
jgi:universal stress protein A